MSKSILEMSFDEAIRQRTPRRAPGAGRRWDYTFDDDDDLWDDHDEAEIGWSIGFDWKDFGNN